jgi:hypothetical protein
MIDEYEESGGTRIGKRDRSTRRKSAPVPLCPAQIPHDLVWDRSQAAAVGSWQLTTWAVARPISEKVAHGGQLKLVVPRSNAVCRHCFQATRSYNGDGVEGGWLIIRTKDEVLGWRPECTEAGEIDRCAIRAVERRMDFRRSRGK